MVQFFLFSIFFQRLSLFLFLFSLQFPLSIQQILFNFFLVVLQMKTNQAASMLQRSSRSQQRKSFILFIMKTLSLVLLFRVCCIIASQHSNKSQFRHTHDETFYIFIPPFRQQQQKQQQHSRKNILIKMKMLSPNGEKKL
jgi:hypothetical protein